MREDQIDSGTGHGAYVVSTLRLEQVFEVAGSIGFTFSLVCEGNCMFSFTSDFGLSYRAYAGLYSYSNPNDITLHFEVPQGTHSFSWTFTGDDSGTSGIAANDRAIIDRISVRHVAVGGATDCAYCEPGYYNSHANRSHCTPASPGYFASGQIGETDRQQQCEGNSYSSGPASSECISCGENTPANSAHTDCEITCGLQTEDREYDLSPLARSDNEMYGPIWDTSDNKYYLNMCTRQHNNHTCFSAHNEPLEVFACQVTGPGIGQDLGNTFGIVPLREPFNELSDGVTVHLTGGTPCHNGSIYFDRQTFIDIPCDPSAGVGSPVPLAAHAETQKCVYEFKWASLYGCPLCTADDYHYYTSECDAFGMTTQTFEWNTNPKSCHGGVELPSPVPVQCAYAVYCGPGQFYDIDSEGCKDAPEGFYSVGNGIRVSSWTELEDGFTSNGFTGTQQHIHSGEDDTSLVFVHNFVRAGTLNVTFSVTNWGDSTAGFSIYVNDVLQGDKVYSTHNQYITRHIEVPSGYRYIRFAFEGGTLASDTAPARAVRIQEITVLGTIWAAPYPIPCPAGTSNDMEGATECKDCPFNTFSSPAARRCSSCSNNEYSVPGSEICTLRRACTMDDYRLVYRECNNSAQAVHFELVEPILCRVNGSTPPPPSNGSVPCFPCSEGSYRVSGSDECKTCAEGKYWSASKGKCTSSVPGHAAVLRRSYLVSPLAGDSLPREFSTGCSGDCLCLHEPSCEDGWRLLGGQVDSGLNLNREVDSYLDLTLKLVTPGSISFVYDITGSPRDGLEFYVNEKQVRLPYHPTDSSLRATPGTHFSVDVDAGLTTFRWNYHQEAKSSGSALLHTILIEGIGGATEDVTCQAGEYTSTGDALYCKECVAGTANPDEAATECHSCGKDSYAPDSGTAVCIRCGSETVANDARTDCETDCIFDFGLNRTWDLSALQQTHGPFPLNGGSNGIWMNVCAKRSSNALCLNEYGESIKTYMCQVDARGNGLDLGNRLDVDLVEVEEDDKAVRLSYTVVGENESPCRTSLTVVCDPDALGSSPEILDNPKDCNLHLRWLTPHGCPVCSDEDYESQVSECLNGDQTVTAVRVGKCSGPAVKSAEHQDCRTEYAFSLTVIVVVLAVLVILIAAIVAVVIHNRRLHTQYTALIREGEGQYEMNQVPGDTASVGAAPSDSV